MLTSFKTPGCSLSGPVAFEEFRVASCYLTPVSVNLILGMGLCGLGPRSSTVGISYLVNTY